MTLKARAGSKPTDAVYETPPGATPSVRIRIRGARTEVLDYSILVDDVLIAAPAGCGGKVENHRPRSKRASTFTTALNWCAWARRCLGNAMGQN